MRGLFDRGRLQIKPLSHRNHDLNISAIGPVAGSTLHLEAMRSVASRIIDAKRNSKPIIMMIGGHVIRAGVQRYLIDLMENGYITCLSMNGSGMIHDFEFALIGATTESVARYIINGQFGLWKETAILNDIINESYKNEETPCMGDSVGRAMLNMNLPNADISILAAAQRLNVAVTVHVGIGYDIIHEHPNCNGAATGALSYNDFLRLASIMEALEGGVVMCFGSAVMAPEVFLKALSMARNTAASKGSSINRFTTLVCDLHNLPDNYKVEASKDAPAYYFRPYKTMLVRTVADGGESFYVRGMHSDTIASLWSAINEAG
ncbi:MAG: hypothetical protein HQL01_05340 [Nitrospirae bacterium]|nr:hypothetical protein [Nitrospirota bacterium]